MFVRALVEKLAVLVGTLAVLVGTLAVWPGCGAAAGAPGGHPIDRPSIDRPSIDRPSMDRPKIDRPSGRVFFIDASLSRAEPRYTIRVPGLAAAFDPRGASFVLGGSRFALAFAGASGRSRLEPLDEQPAKANFIAGRDSAGWKTGLPVYSGLAYRELYPGIDLVFKPHGRYLKSEFIVAPGAQLGDIHLRYTGLRSVAVHPSGELVLSAAGGELREDAPQAYVLADGAAVPAPVRYRRFANGDVGFEAGRYPAGAALVIDPVITFSTFFGGSGADTATAVAVDAAGSAYIAGWTESPDLPAAGRIGQAGSVDAYVAKFDQGGARLAYCTYIGGSGEDRALGIAVDATGAAVITGFTNSADFPAISTIQSTLKGSRNAFVVKLSGSGAALLFSTYFGGRGSDSGNAASLDGAGNIFVAGVTSSSDFPVVNAAQATIGGQQDAFAAKFSADGAAVLYSTFLGGANNDQANAIAIDAAGAAYIAGSTMSRDFPALGALQPNLRGQLAGFVTKLSPSGAAVVYSTYLGGSGGASYAPESAQAIAVDAAGGAYVAGVTSSTDFPVAAAAQSVYAGESDAFVAKLNPSGGGLVYSTFFGGHGRDVATGVAVDRYGAAYVTGYTASIDFPSLNAIQPGNAGLFDVFLAKFDLAGNPVYSTFLGGAGSDSGAGVALDNSGNVFLAGQTLSPDFPVINPAQGVNLGNYGGFLTKIADPTFGCAYVLAPPALTAPAAGSAQSLTINTAGICAWSVTPDSAWLRAVPSSGVGPAIISVAVDANPATTQRTGNLMAGGVTVPVTQAPPPCVFALSVARVHATAARGMATVAISTTAACTWTVASNAPWLTPVNPSGSGSGTLTYAYSANVTGAARTGTLNISGQLYSVTQGARVPITWPPLPATDFNGDGMADAAVYYPANGSLFTLLSNGTRSYTAVGNAAGAPYDIVRNGDFNGDLLGDLFLYYRAGGAAKLALSDGTGHFTYTSLSFFPNFDVVLQGDFNGDGKTDLLLYNKTSGLATIAISDGVGGFAQHSQSYNPGFTTVAIGDYYGDGRSGALFYNSSTGALYLGRSDVNGNPTFSIQNVGTGYDAVVPADIDGDGLCDFILYRSKDGTTFIAHSNGDGTFRFVFQFWSPGFTAIKPGDYNGDGKADLLLYNGSNTIGYQGFGDGRGDFTFQSLFWGGGFDFAQAADLNGDGQQDVLIYRTSDGTSFAGWSGDSAFNYAYAYFGPGRIVAQ